MADDLVPRSVPPPRTVPFREDCWTEEATSTLVDTWGRRFLELNRGNLRQKDWQEVADAVNALHGHTKKSHRTDVQCKNRIDTLKKKYKIEKSRVSSSNGAVTSSWLFYSRLDHLIGSVVPNKTGPRSKSPASPPMAVPLSYRKPIAEIAQPSALLPQKRSCLAVNDSSFRRNYSAAAAAAAAEEEEEVEEVEEEEESEEEASLGLDWSEQNGNGEGDREGEAADGIRSLARAIEKMGEMYERVEREKQMQMIDLEKQRIQFAKDLEVQRMQLFMDMQVQLEKLKKGSNKQTGSLKW